MPSPIARLVLGKTNWGASPPELRINTTGASAEQWWRIDHAVDDVQARTADGLPDIGKQYHSDFPLLRVVDIRISRIGGVHDTAAQAGMYHSAQVFYATPQFNGRIPEPTPGTHYTVFRGGVQSIHRVFDARLELGTTRFNFVEPAPGTPGSTAPIQPVDAGRGYQTVVGTCQFEVHSYFAVNRFPGALLTRAIQLSQYGFVNRDVVTLPPLYGALDRFTFDPGQLKYETFSLQVDRGIVVFSQVLNAAPNWFGLYVEQNEIGEAEGEPIQVVQYPAANFAGLWP